MKSKVDQRNMRDHVEERNGGRYVTGTRISLDSVVYAFNRGASPETILHSFPALASLENVYGAITYYLANKDEVDTWLARREKEFEDLRLMQVLPDGMRARVEAARQSIHTGGD